MNINIINKVYRSPVVFMYSIIPERVIAASYNGSAGGYHDSGWGGNGSGGYYDSGFGGSGSGGYGDGDWPSDD